MRNIWYMIRLLWRIDKKYMFISLISIPGGIINPIIDVYLLQMLLQQVSEAKSIKGTLIVLGIMFLCSLINLFTDSYLGKVCVPRHSEKISLEMKLLVLDKVNSCDVSCFEDPEFYNSYVAAARESLTRPMAVWSTVIDTVSLLAGFGTILTLIVMVDPYLIIFAIINALIRLIPQLANTKHNYDYENESRAVSRESGYVDRVMYEKSYIYDIKLTNIGSVFREKLIGCVSRQLELVRKYGWRRMSAEIFDNLFGSVFTLTTWLYLGLRIIFGYYTIASFTAMFNACLSFSNSISNFSLLLPTYKSHKLFINNFRHFMEYESRVGEDVTGLPDAEFNRDIVFHNVSFTYPGKDEPALRDIDLTIHKGEKIAIVGRNGAGKSTLIKLLLRFYDPSNGTITIDGKEYSSIDLKSLRHLFSCCFQDSPLYSVTLGQNIAMDNEYDKRVAIDSAIKANMLFDEEMLSTGVNRDYDPDGLMFSGGESQRVGIARSYYSNRVVAIFDEANSALDPIAEKELNDIIFDASSGKTTIFISHRLTSAVKADRIIYIEDGKILEIGTHDELLSLNGKYALMWNSQAETYA